MENLQEEIVLKVTHRTADTDWLGEFPKHWTLRRFKYLFKERNERSDEGDGDLLSVSQYTGVTKKADNVDEGEILTNASSLEGYKRIFEGDLVSNIMLAWNGSLGFSPHNGITSPAYSVYELLNGDRRYFHYLLRSELYKAEFKRQSTGVIDSRLRLYTDDFYRIYSLVPPLDEQTRVANFLDDKTAKIDRAIAQKERLIALLKERRQILIHRAVTRGLNPNVKLKDSGVEWIGMVPEHWEITEARYIKRPGTDITYGIVQAGPNIPGGIPYIRTGDMSGENFPAEGYLCTSRRIADSFKRSEVATGDLVIAIRATLGKALLVPEYLNGANLTQGTAKISPGSRVKSDFLYWLFQSYPQDEIDLYAKGTTFREITLNRLNRIRIALPPISEQSAISKKLSQVAEQVSRIIRVCEAEISKLKEYKTCLIDGAVRGRIYS